MATFTYQPAEDTEVDPQYNLDQHPCWAVQDCTAYGGGYAITEFAKPGEPFWVRFHGERNDLQLAQQECAALAGVQN